MKKIYFFAILFFTLTVYVSAQDIIVLTNGNTIAAKVEEISPTEIKYRRFDNLKGPLIIIYRSEVSSIKFENGTVEVINPPANIRDNVQETLSKSTAPTIDPNKLFFSLSFEPSGFLAGGPSTTGEFLKGATISSFYFSFPSLSATSKASGFGFGMGGSINHLWKNNKLGGFYLGGLFEWNTFPYLGTYTNPYAVYNPYTDTFSSQTVTEESIAHNFVIALNSGYRFVTKSGAYFRTGVTMGMTLSTIIPTGFYFKPDISTGYIWGANAFNNATMANSVSNSIGNNVNNSIAKDAEVIVAGSETAFSVNLSKLSTLKINSGSDVETALKGNYQTNPGVRNEAPLTKIYSDVFILLPREALPPNVSLYKRLTITCKYYDAAGVEIPQGDSQVTVTMVYDSKGNLRGLAQGKERNLNMLFKESNVGGPSGKINKDIGIVLTFEKAPQAILFQNANENVAFIELTSLVFHNGDYKSK
jgi:hypothetical protein